MINREDIQVEIRANPRNYARYDAYVDGERIAYYAADKIYDAKTNRVVASQLGHPEHKQDYLRVQAQYMAWKNQPEVVAEEARKRLILTVEQLREAVASLEQKWVFIRDVQLPRERAKLADLEQRAADLTTKGVSHQ